LKSNYNDMLSI